MIAMLVRRQDVLDLHWIKTGSLDRRPILLERMAGVRIDDDQAIRRFDDELIPRVARIAATAVAPNAGGNLGRRMFSVRPQEPLCHVLRPGRGSVCHRFMSFSIEHMHNTPSTQVATTIRFASSGIRTRLRGADVEDPIGQAT